MILSTKLRTNFLLALTLVATISPHGMVFAEVVGHNDKHEQLAVYARLASVEREYKEQIEALGRRFDEQDAELRKQDAELQDLRRQVATGPEASGRRLQLKGAKSPKGNGSDSGGGGGGGGGLTTKQLSIIDALDNCMELSSSTDELIIQGCDFIVRGNGGFTKPTTVTGKGNLIVGYNEGSTIFKTGLNNLVVGPGHTYTSTGGVVFGQLNVISAASATVTGGLENEASGFASSVTGGQNNTASGSTSSVSGGISNKASGGQSSVTGGKLLDATAANENLP